MKRDCKTYLTLLLLALTVFIPTSCRDENGEGQEGRSSVKIGDSTPEFVLTGNDGEDITSASLRGQAYILTFFDTGCPDCQKELPVIQKIYDKYQEMIPILNVPRSQSASDVQSYWDATGLTMPFYIPQDKNLYYKFANSIIPRIYVVDSNGNVNEAFTDQNAPDFETLDGILQNLISKSPVKKGYVNVSVRLKTPTLNMIDEYYFQNEFAVSYLSLYFFDAETKQLYRKVNIDRLKQIENIYFTDYDGSYTWEDLRIKVGKYDIFAVTNYRDIGDIHNENELLNWIDYTTYKDGVVPSLPESGPVMSNRAMSHMNVNLIPWDSQNYLLHIEVERVLAKLSIGVDKNSFELYHGARRYATLNITNYTFVNLNKCYYLFQHTDAMTELSAQPEFIIPEYFSDYTEFGNQYVIDPYFYNKTTNQADAESFAEKYESWYGNFSLENLASMPSAGNYGYAYILENTSFKTSQKNGYSPGIVFKAAVVPDYVYLYDDKERIVVRENRAENWSGTIYLYNFNFYGTIRAINADSDLALDELRNYSDAELRRYGIKQCKYNMGAYETYYTYWIRHRGTTPDSMGPMEYGVIRNNYYQMKVTGITGIGNSVITPDIMRDNYPNSYIDVEVN